jgi:hypothetical protein
MLYPTEIAICRREGMLDEAIEWAQHTPPAIVLVTTDGRPAVGGLDCPLLPWPEGGAGAELRELLGLGVDTYLAAFERRRVPAWHPWLEEYASDCAAIAEVIKDAGARPIVAIGRDAADSLGLHRIEPFVWAKARAPLPDMPGLRSIAGAAAAWIPAPGELGREDGAGELPRDERALAKRTLHQAFQKALPVVQWPAPAPRAGAAL